MNQDNQKYLLPVLRKFSMIIYVILNDVTGVPAGGLAVM